MKIYTYKSCSTCKAATKWLDQNDHTYEELPIRETPPTKKELETMLMHVVDIKKLFNVAGRDYRSMELKDKLPSMSKAEQLALLRSNGNLVKRPFLLADGIGLVGFKPEIWAAALSRLG